MNDAVLSKAEKKKRVFTETHTQRHEMSKNLKTTSKSKPRLNRAAKVRERQEPPLTGLKANRIKDRRVYLVTVCLY